MSRANDYSESKAVGTSASAAAPSGEVIVYEASDGAARVDVRVDRDTVWLTQRQMAEVFDTSTDNVGLHVKNIFQDGELEEKATAEDFSVVQTEGQRRVRRNLRHYNLDAIISVGYRVNSKRGVRFRQWATHTLREHLIRGYTMNEQRLAERGLREARETLDLLSWTLAAGSPASERRVVGQPQVSPKPDDDYAKPSFSRNETMVAAHSAGSSSGRKCVVFGMKSYSNPAIPSSSVLGMKEKANVGSPAITFTGQARRDSSGSRL